MIEIEFTEQDIAQLHYERFHHPDPHVQQRLEVVYLKALGLPHKEIGRIARQSQKTVRRDLRLYQDGGIDALKQDHHYRPTSELDLHRETIEAEFKAKPPKTIKEAIDRVEKLTGIRRSPTQMR
jgi:transposase